MMFNGTELTNQFISPLVLTHRFLFGWFNVENDDLYMMINAWWNNLELINKEENALIRNKWYIPACRIQTILFKPELRKLSIMPVIP